MKAPQRKQPAHTSLPVGAHAFVESLIGTFYGRTKAEVLRFMLISWMHDNATAGLPRRRAKETE